MIGLYVQSYFKIGDPLLPSHISLKILLRSLIIVLGWVFIIGPLLTQLLHAWLRKKQTQSKQDVKEVLQLLPYTQRLIAQSWKQSSCNKGWKRIKTLCRIILVNALNPSVNKQIVILSAPVQTGKTTSLVKWSEGKTDVYGILTPVVDGKRMFMDAQTRQLFLMEAKEGEVETLSVGRFVFSKTNFNRAMQIIRDAMHKEGWLVIDEIGPMELRGEGFHDILKEVLASRKQKILLVVREKDNIADKVKEYFRISGGTFISSIEASLQ